MPGFVQYGVSRKILFNMMYSMERKAQNSVRSGNATKGPELLSGNATKGLELLLLFIASEMKDERLHF